MTIPDGDVMLTYNLNKKNSLPFYINLYELIKKDIEHGKIVSNTKMPSKRELSEHLRISVLTVQNAYAQLIAEGYIYSIERVGYFVSEIQTFEKKGMTKVEVKNYYSKENSDKKNLIYFSENAADSKKFPFSIWSKQMRRVISENYDNLLDPVPNRGLWLLRKSISDYLYRYRGMIVDPNLIVIGAGAEYLYFLLIRILGRSKTYAVESPGYRKISQVYTAEEVKIKHIPLDQNGLRVDMLNNVDVVYTSPSHNFPTGIVMPISRRMELLNWAHSTEGSYIIEDDYDSEFRFDGKPLPTLYSIDSENKTIYMNTFSKTIAPSLRISYMILPEKLSEKHERILGFSSCPVCSFEQYILANFINEGYFERHISRMKRYYKQHREAVFSLIKNSELGEISEIKEEMSGIHFLLNLKTNKTDSELKLLAREKGLDISFLSDYCEPLQNTLNSQLICSYSGIELDNVKKAINNILEII